MNPWLGKGKCEMRQITCTCIECINTLEKPWVHGVSPIELPRYAKVDGCVHHSILGDYNKWIIMDFTRDSETDKECFEEIHKILVQSIGNNMAEFVEINCYGAVDTYDSRADGFYVLKFAESPHTLQEEVEVNDKIIESGSLVCAAHYMSPAQKILGGTWALKVGYLEHLWKWIMC